MARRKSIWPPGRCMFCGEEAPDSALKCQHCGKVLLQASATRREENLTEADFAVSLQPGDVLAGRYRLLGELGGGITGRVWTAESLRGITTVCLRILPPILARDDVRVAGLKRDVAIALKLSHSNICGLRAFESDGEISFLAMEYVPGRTLSRMLDAKPGRRMSLEEAVCIARGIAKALDYGHSQSPPILHGDVKPSNIIVTPEGQPKLLGYVVGRELARAVMSVTGLEIPRRVLYTSPEAHAGQAETSASDVYSFAAVLYDCLAGHPPFWEGVVGDQLLNQEPPKIPELPKLVNGVLLAALAKTPAIRPRRASEVVQRIAVVPAAGPRVEAPAARAPARRQRAGPSDKPRPYLALRRPAEPLVGAPLVWERLGYAGLIAVGVVAFGFFVAAFIAPTVRGRGPLADRQAGVPAKEAAGGPVEKAAPKTEDGAEPMPPADAEAARPAKPLPQRDVATSAARDEGAAATVPGKRPVAEVREQPRVAAAGKRSLRPDSEAPGSPRPVQQLPARSGAFRADGPSEPAPPSREQLLWKLAAEYQGNVDRIHQEERALYEQRAAPLRVLYTYNEDFSACYRNIPGAREQVAALRQRAAALPSLNNRFAYLQRTLASLQTQYNREVSAARNARLRYSVKGDQQWLQSAERAEAAARSVSAEINETSADLSNVQSEIQAITATVQRWNEEERRLRLAEREALARLEKDLEARVKARMRQLLQARKHRFMHQYLGKQGAIAERQRRIQTKRDTIELLSQAGRSDKIENVKQEIASLEAEIEEIAEQMRGLEEEFFGKRQIGEAIPATEH